MWSSSIYVCDLSSKKTSSLEFCSENRVATNISSLIDNVLQSHINVKDDSVPIHIVTL